MKQDIGIDKMYKKLNTSKVSKVKNIKVTKDIPIPKSMKIVKAGLILIFLNEYVGTLLIKSTAIIKVYIGTQ